jgi:hypothetical protein
MIELLIRIYADVQPEISTDGVFLFGQTEDNEASVLEKSIELLQHSYTKRILIIYTQPISGHPGFDAWKQKLVREQISENAIVSIPLPETPIIHTLIEAEALMRFAKEQAYTSLYVTAAPFHQLRAFMTAVTAAIKIYPQIRLYSKPGMAQPWLQKVLHSQGKTYGTRSELIAGELERIEKYGNKGDLLSAQQVLAYLNERDGRK